MYNWGETKDAHPTESTAKLAFFIHTAKYPLHIAPLSSVFYVFSIFFRIILASLRFVNYSSSASRQL